jgi:hypothetical protein
MANSAPKGSSTLNFSTPFFKNNSYPITGKQLLQGFNDVDLKNGDVLKVSFPESEHGTLTPTKNGDWSFTPDKDFVGKVTFDYLVSDKKMQYVDAKVSFEVVSDSVASKDTAAIFKSNGYYSTFADFAKAAYYLAPKEQLHSGQTEYVVQPSVNGDGQNYVKPYADEAWARLDKNWAVLKPSDLNMGMPGTYHWISAYEKVHIPTPVDSVNLLATFLDPLGLHDDKGDTEWFLEPDGVYHGNNAAAFAVRSKDSVVISFRGTNDNDGGALPVTEDMSDWTNMDAHYGELLNFTNYIDQYVALNGIKNVYVTGHSLGGGMAL